MDKRILLAAGAVAAAIGLFLVLRPENDEPSTPTQPTVPATTTGETTTEETTAIPTTPTPPPPLVLVVRDGRVAGGIKRPSVSRGTGVVVVVRADVEDELHVHGYDLMRDVAPGNPARIAFQATIAGVFEIELEQSHLLLAELEVQP
jgi:hypothetical protein